MRRVPLTESLRIIAQGSLNWLSQRPVVVSFEVTNSCTCYCKHCDHGGPKDDFPQYEAGRLQKIHGSASPLRRSGLRRRTFDAQRLDRDRPQHQIGFRTSLHHPGFELVAHDQRPLPRTARCRSRRILRQPGFPRRTARRLPRTSGIVQAFERDHAASVGARLRRCCF